MKQPVNPRQQSTWRICALFLPDVAKPVPTTTIATTLHLLEPLAQEIFAITGNFPENAVISDKIHIINIGVKPRDSARSPMLIRVPRFIMMQIKISYNLFKIAGKIDVVFLAAGASTLLLPALLAKLLGKKIVSLRPGTDAIQKLAEFDYQKTLFGIGKYLFVPILGILERLSYQLSDRIIVFRSDFTTPALKRYVNKVSFSGSRFYADTDSFKVERNLDNRENLVGYIGRLYEVKGIMNLVKAVPLILTEFTDAKFVIGGEGALGDSIEKELKEAGLDNRVTLSGWIPHEKLPQYLNEIKLLVIPSYEETGPHIVFEAMACGTPVLATAVGVIPDVIKDGETGFIIEDNSPECIAHNVIRALKHPNLDQVAKAARTLVEREYTLEAAVERYRSILASLG